MGRVADAHRCPREEAQGFVQDGIHWEKSGLGLGKEEREVGRTTDCRASSG